MQVGPADAQAEHDADNTAKAVLSGAGVQRHEDEAGGKA